MEMITIDGEVVKINRQLSDLHLSLPKEVIRLGASVIVGGGGGNEFANGVRAMLSNLAAIDEIL